ncbi:glycoside hydrolase family 25 protein [Rhizohabitans arisaemae]|uniref:glycoside hydrolase family 25 protein n=1 Tax=Rhizohabitans arisaemae TaxID=2720610 RepID=UPI0024B07189|nr:glycoside hydrolase family 25 protein [Rhizohabitans arisaemae]
MLHGIDVSAREETDEWAVRRAGERVDFVFVKATEGAKRTDPRFVRHWRLAAERGLVRGAYHVARPGGDADGDVANFLRTVRPERGDLLALDLTVLDGRPPHEVAEFARRWCARIRTELRVPPFVYTHSWLAHGGNCAGLEGYPLWIAAHLGPPGRPEVPAPWREWAVHQYTSVPVNRNVYAGTRRALAEFGYQGGDCEADLRTRDVAGGDPGRRG